MDLSTVNEGNEIYGIIKTDIFNAQKLRKHKTTFNQSKMPKLKPKVRKKFNTGFQADP